MRKTIKPKPRERFYDGDKKYRTRFALFPVWIFWNSNFNREFIWLERYETVQTYYDYKWSGERLNK